MRTLKESLISNVTSGSTQRITSVKNSLDRILVTDYIKFILNMDFSKQEFADTCVSLDSSKGKVTFDVNAIVNKYSGIYIDFAGLIKDTQLNINHIHFKNTNYRSAGDNYPVYNWFNRTDIIDIPRPITISGGPDIATITGIRNLNCTDKLTLINVNLVGPNLLVPVKLTGDISTKFISQYGLVLSDNMIYSDGVSNKIFREFGKRFDSSTGQMSYEPMMSNELCFKELVKEIEKFNKFLIDGNIIVNNMYNTQGQRTELKLSNTEALGISRTGDSGIKEFISKYGKYFNEYKVYKFVDIKEHKSKKHKYDKYHCIIFKGPKIVKSI